MKYAALSVVCLGLGYWLQRLQSPRVEELELQSTIAWNEGNLEVAERQARRAFGKSPKAMRAREVLLRTSAALQNPEIKLAILLEEHESARSPERALSELGRLALASYWFRLADDYFASGVRQFPENEALQRQSVALSGLRLDAEEMQRRLTNWARYGKPTPDLVVMALGLWSIDTRGASPSEAWLRAALEADASDLESRLGLARALLAMGRYRECIPLLESHARQERAALLLARAYATTKNTSAAAKHLPAREPSTLQADYWFTCGLIAIENDDWTAAETSLAAAVRLRPLDQAFRSRYCTVLRRQGQANLLEQQVRELDVVVRISHLSQAPGLAKQQQSLGELEQMCRSVGAHEAAEVLSKSVGR